MAMYVDGSAVDQEKLLKLLPQIDEYVLGQKALSNLKRSGVTWAFTDDGVLEFRIRYASDA